MVKIFKNVKRLKLKITSIILLIALLTLEFSPFAVKATAQQLQYYSPGVVSVGKDAVNGKNVWYSNATLGGETAYCIDYTCPAPNGTMTFRDYMSDAGMAVLMHGYPNCSPADIGCNSVDEAYMATQMALWEVMNRTGESHKAGLQFRVDNIQPKAGMVDFYNRTKAAAAKLVAMAETQPYNEVPTLTIDNANVKANVQGEYALVGPYTANVTGTSASTVKSITANLINAPASASIVDVNGNAKTSLNNGESVYVKMKVSEEDTSFKINFKSDVDRKVGVIYEVPGKTVQDYARLDTVPVSMEIPLEIVWKKDDSRGRIHLVKNDQDNQPVYGAVFELVNSKGEVVATESTGTDGVIDFYLVPVGQYTLREKSAPSGYVIKEASKNITVNSGEVTNVEFENERITGKLVITKVDDLNKPIENVTFEIYDHKGAIYDTVTTDKDGKASINLEYGTYYFKETKAPEGYIMDSTMYTFDVDAENRTFNKTITNQRVKGSLLIVKKDDKGTPIEGVKFDILDANKNKLITLTTNAKGLAGMVNQLPVGTYYYQEVEAPDNVIIDHGIYEFKMTVSEDDPTVGAIIRKDIVNETVKGSLKIYKVNDDDRAIKGVKFDVLNSEKEVVETLTTDANGYAYSKELTPGEYYYKEVEVPAGYILDSKEYKFNITNEKKLYAVKVVNHFAEGSLEITKYDSNGKTLAGVEFDILDESDNVVDHIITNADGKATSKQLRMGTYYYKETQAPENVVMDTEKHAFTLTDNGQIVRKTVVNDVKEGKLKIIKVDENNEPLAGVTFEIYDLKMKKIDTIVTNEEGIAESKELEKGTYYYRETKAPEGIKVDSSIHQFTVVEDGQNVIENVVNYYIKGDLKLYKLEDGTTTPLAGAKFEIRDENGEVVETIISDENGVAQSKKLSYGTYYFEEIEAPKGYNRDSNIYMFKIEEENTIEHIVYNTKKEIPKTGGLLSDNMVIVLAVALVSISGYVVMKAMTAKKEN